MKKTLLTSFVLALATACSGDTSPATDAGVVDAGEIACAADPDMTLSGDTKAIGAFEFRNAFDTNDLVVYDPNDAASLPGPLMVDTWGDRGAAAHGTLGVFPPGFSAPLHTHSNAYNGVVLRGEMTNPFGTNLDVFLDGDAGNNHGAVVMGPGSFWHVPARSQHTTTCVGPEVCWFYFHSEALFDFAPIVDAMGALAPGVTLESPHVEAVQTPKSNLTFAGEPGSFVQFAPAWGDMGSAAHGTFGLFESGAQSPVHVHSAAYYGVVVEGEVTNPFNGDTSPTALDRGGYWQVPADSVHVTACAAGTPCLFYFHSRAGFDFTPVCE